MRKIQLPERLRRIASLVPEGMTVADIGCDHAYLAVALLEEGKVPYVICSDINEGPIALAKAHLKEHGLEDKAECRLMDGISGLQPGEAETLVIAGMGGMLIRDILLQGNPAVLASVQTLVLQPQTEPEVVRQTVHALSFHLVDEAFVEDRGKTYVILKAVHGEEHYDDPFTYRYGRILLEKRDPGYLNWLVRRAEHLREWSSMATDPEEQNKLSAEASFIENLLR